MIHCQGCVVKKNLSLSLSPSLSLSLPLSPLSDHMYLTQRPLITELLVPRHGQLLLPPPQLSLTV